MSQKSRILADSTKLGIYLVLATVLVVLALYSFATTFLGFVLAGSAGTAALVFGWLALTTSGTAACPSCNLPVRGLRIVGANTGVLCRSCTSHLEGKNGELWVMADDRVADTHVFAAPLPEKLEWPDGCAVCGKPTTNMQPASYTRQEEASLERQVTVAVGSLGFRRAVNEVTTTIQVPHCDEHKRGVILQSAGMNQTITGLLVVFRSQQMFRAFCQKNQVSVVSLN